MSVETLSAAAQLYKNHILKACNRYMTLKVTKVHRQ